MMSFYPCMTYNAMTSKLRMTLVDDRPTAAGPVLRGWRLLLCVSSIVLLYAGLARLVLRYFSNDGSLAIFWPAAGISLAAMLLLDRKCLPAVGIAIGAFAGAAWSGASLPVSALLALPSTIEPMIGLWLLKRLDRFDPRLDSANDYYRLAGLAGVFSPILPAVFGVAILTAMGAQAPENYGRNLALWWLGDTLGIILVTPLILLWARRPTVRSGNAVESMLVVVAGIGVGLVVFEDILHAWLGKVSLGYWLFLVITWAAVRCGPKVVSLLLVATTSLALLGAAQGTGFFANDLKLSHLANFWCYTTILSTVGMSLALNFGELRKTQAILRQRENELQRAQQLAGLGRWSWNLQTGAVVWSDELYRFFGRDPALPPATMSEAQRYFTAESWEPLAAGVESALTRGEAYEQDAEIVRPDGSRGWMVIQGEAVRNRNGKIVELHGTIQDITERKASEAALRESRQRLSILVEHAPAALAMFDREMRYLVASRCWLDDYGLGDADLAGRSHYEIFPEIPERWRDVHRRGMNGETIVANEDRFTRADGSKNWLHWEVRPWYLDDGAVGGIVIFTEDITSRKQAELALAESEARYRAVIETAEDGFWMLDGSGRLLATNRAYARRSGYTIAELLALHARDLDADESPEQIQRHLARIQAEGSGLFETTHRSKTGELWPAEVIASYSAETGGLFFAFIRDISERRQIAEALQASEQRFRATFEQAAMGIALASPDGRFIRVNQKLGDILGYEPDSLLHRHYREITHPDDAAAGSPLEQKLLSGAQATATMEKRYLHRDGRAIWARVTIALVRTADGAPEYFIAAIEDITERKHTEQTLAALQAEAERLNKFQIAAQTASAIAHELHQPLNAMAAYSEAALRLLRSGNEAPGKLQHALESNAQQAKRAGRVVTELMSFMNQGEILTAPLDLNRLVTDVVQQVKAEGCHGVDFELSLDSSLRPVDANRLQIEKVLTNLIENSVEAMRDAGVESRAISVKLNTAADEGMAQVSIADTGPGIDAETLHRVFRPFFTTKPKGLGMGLAISRSIVEVHGGQLWVESTPGVGAIFHFTLPFIS